MDGVVVQLEKEEVDRETAKWKCSLIVYSIGECPGYNSMCRFISQSWNSVAEPEVYLHEEGLIETRVKQHNAQAISKCIAPGWGHANNYSAACNGRIWVVWDPNYYTVIILRVEDQLIHCLVQNASEVNCYLTIIYGFNSIEQRRTLWGYLKDIAQGLNSPWAICGDFNALLFAQDRLSGNPVQFAEIKDFAKCLQETHLNELSWRGDYFTWTNKRKTVDRVCSRLDRAFGNHEWIFDLGTRPTNI
ncbi:uncharacterized protein LOC132031893 [Lycium ferocissimum]|uniref:uncharacterized protein LOC132031893 n=1 Tax=Lycium ferocissimum TaxID=112874 RepID=UPI002815DE9E|nr:uncharacterized protein LOC132031893 [Lycium ferocissimum]